MKSYLIAIMALIGTAAILSFTNSSENHLKFVCQWFIYDDPAITNPSLDFPSTLTQATTVANYRLVTVGEAELCSGVRKLCAICAEVDVNGKPILTSTSVIVTDHLTPYFNQPNETLRVPNTNFIREMFNF